MKALKIVLFIIAVLFVLYIVVCFAGPKKLEISRSIAINATPESVFGEISDYERWKVWAPWSRRDPDMKSTITGTPASVGYKMTWASKTQGDGEQEFIEVIPNQKVRSSLKFKGWEGVSFSDMVLVPEGEGTIVNWTMDGGEVPFLLRGIMFFLGAVEALEKDYDEGLSGLKKSAETVLHEPAFEIEEASLMDIKYVSKMYPAVRAEELDTTVYNAAYREIYKIVPANNIAGVPMSIWRNYNEQTNTVDIEIAVPVGTEIKVPTGLIAGKIPGGKVIKHIHYGNYNKIGKAWDKLMEYIGKNNKPRHDGFEMYVKGPANTTNEEEYVTWLIVPVE